jgi:hypothetical protein
MHAPEINFFLKSERKYNFFLTLPQEVRKCLTFLPQSVVTESDKLNRPLENQFINLNQTIQVGTKTAKALAPFGVTCKKSHFYESIPKPMLPEEEKYKKLLNKNTR